METGCRRRSRQVAALLLFVRFKDKRNSTESGWIMGSTRYIMSMGELTRKDGKNVYIPIENTKEIYCMNEVTVNTKLLDFLSQNHVIVHFFNYYEGYSGTFYPKN
jgi:NAD kinase